MELTRSEEITRATVADANYRLELARENADGGNYIRAAQLAREAADLMAALDRRLTREWAHSNGF